MKTFVGIAAVLSLVNGQFLTTQIPFSSCDGVLTAFDSCIGNRFSGCASQCPQQQQQQQPPRPREPNPCCDCVMPGMRDQMDQMMQQLQPQLQQLAQTCSSQCTAAQDSEMMRHLQMMAQGPPPRPGGTGFNGAGINRFGNTTFQFPGFGNGSFQFPGTANGTYQFPGFENGSFQFPVVTNGTYQFPGFGNGTYQFPGFGNGTFQFPGFGNGAFQPRTQGQQNAQTYPRNNNGGRGKRQIPNGVDDMVDEDEDGMMEKLNALSPSCRQCVQPQFDQIHSQKQEQMKTKLGQMCPELGSRLDELVSCKMAMKAELKRVGQSIMGSGQFGGNNQGFGGPNQGFGGNNQGFGGNNQGFGGNNQGFGGFTQGFRANTNFPGNFFTTRAPFNFQGNNNFRGKRQVTPSWYRGQQTGGNLQQQAGGNQFQGRFQGAKGRKGRGGPPPEVLQAAVQQGIVKPNTARLMQTCPMGPPPPPPMNGGFTPPVGFPNRAQFSTQFPPNRFGGFTQQPNNGNGRFQGNFNFGQNGKK